MSKRKRNLQRKVIKKKKREELNLVTGIFRRNEKGFGFVDMGEDLEDIYIDKEKTLKALNGDKVLVNLIGNKEEGKRQEGKIIEIIEHNKDKLVGTYKDYKDYGFVIPDNKALSTDIFVAKSASHGAKNNQKVVVKITKFADKDTNKSEGKVIEILGDIDETGIDILSLVKEYEIPYDFPREVIEEAKNVEEEIKNEEIEKRLDLRNNIMFTIDGEDAKDLDDAVEVSKNEDGTYTLGVHIADVSHYVTKNSNLDKEAIKRGTSVYLLDRVIPMLPKELSNGICSLNEGKDRLSMSCIMKINNSGRVVEKKVYKSVIKVTRRMNYHDVNNIFKHYDIENKIISKEGIEKEELENIYNSYEKYKKFEKNFLLMRELKNILMDRRLKDGYIDLDIPESKVILDEKGKVLGIKKYDFLESNSVIEQFMLTANESVAEIFRDLKAPFIYRIHEIPDIEKTMELNSFLMEKGYKIDGLKNTSESITPKAFANIIKRVKGLPEEKVISTMVLRTLRMARYDSENKGHFGIASKCYCHFTSPIRRYPDLFIHRIISSYIDNNFKIDDKQKKKYEKEVVKYAESSSICERVAQEVERTAVDIKMAEYMEDHVGETFEGIISGVTQFGIFVELENTIEGLIRFDDLGSGYYIYDERRKEIYSQDNKEHYSIGDSIEILVIYASKQERRIDFANSNYYTKLDRKPNANNGKRNKKEKEEGKKKKQSTRNGIKKKARKRRRR